MSKKRLRWYVCSGYFRVMSFRWKLLADTVAWAIGGSHVVEDYDE